MTFREVNDISGFFTKYKTKYGTSFIEVFGDLSDDVILKMDIILSDTYGERLLISQYKKYCLLNSADSTMEKIVDMCYYLLLEKWKKLKTVFEKAYSMDVEKPLETSTESGRTINTQNKENAFDDVETASDTESTDTQNDFEETRKRNDKSVVKNALEYFSFVNTNNFMFHIMHDIIDVSCLDVW